jgi:hypothetical protein
VRYGGTQQQFMIQDYFTANNRFGFVIRGRTGKNVYV